MTAQTMESPTSKSPDHSLSASSRSIRTQSSPPSSDIGSNHNRREASLDEVLSNEDYDMLLSKDFGRVGDSEVDSESTRSRSASEASFGSGGDVAGTRDMRLSFPDPLSSHQSDHDRAPSAPTSERANNHRDLNSSFLSDYSFVGDISRSSSPSLRMLASVEIDTTPRRLSDAATSTSSNVDQDQLETITREPVDNDEERGTYQAGEIGKWLARTTTPAKRRPTVDHAVSTSDHPPPLPCSFTFPTTATSPPPGQLDVVLVGREELLSTMEAAVVERISKSDFGRSVRLSFETVVAKHFRNGWERNTPLLVVYVEDNPKVDIEYSTESLSGSSATVVPRPEWTTCELIHGRMMHTPVVDETLPLEEQVNGYIYNLDEFKQLDVERLVRELAIIVRDAEVVELEGEGTNETPEATSSMWNSLGRLSSLLLVSLTAAVVIAASLLDSTPSFDHSISTIAQYSPAPLTSRLPYPPTGSINIILNLPLEPTALASVPSTGLSPSPNRPFPPSAKPIRTLHAYELIEIHSAHALAIPLLRSKKNGSIKTKSATFVARSTPPRFIFNSEGYIVRDISLVRDCRAGEGGTGGCMRLVVKEITGTRLGERRDWRQGAMEVGGGVVGVLDDLLRQLLLIDLPSLANLLRTSNLLADSTQLLTQARTDFVKRTRLAQGGLRKLSSQPDHNVVPSLRRFLAAQYGLQVGRLVAVDRWIIAKESELRMVVERKLLRGLGIESREEILPLLHWTCARIIDSVVGYGRSLGQLYGTLPSVQSISSSEFEGSTRVSRQIEVAKREAKELMKWRVGKAVRGREKVVQIFRRASDSEVNFAPSRP